MIQCTSLIASGGEPESYSSAWKKQKQKTKEKVILQLIAYLVPLFQFSINFWYLFSSNRDLHLILKQIAVTSNGLAQNLGTNDDFKDFIVLIEGSSGPYPSYLRLLIVLH